MGLWLTLCIKTLLGSNRERLIMEWSKWKKIWCNLVKSIVLHTGLGTWDYIRTHVAWNWFSQKLQLFLYLKYESSPFQGTFYCRLTYKEGSLFILNEISSFSLISVYPFIIIHSATMYCAVSTSLYADTACKVMHYLSFRCIQFRIIVPPSLRRAIMAVWCG